MNQVQILFWLGFGLFSAAQAGNFAGPQCTSYYSPHLQRSVEYCVHRSHPQQPTPGQRVAYFFHGMMGNGKNWQTKGYATALTNLVRAKNLAPITFVSFDTDEDSFFSDYEGDAKSSRSYETWFLKEFMPMIERTYGVCRQRECRGTIGLSMGGFGALKMALKFPQIFSAAAANCPALPPFSIHQPTSRWKDYFNRHPIGSWGGMMILQRVKDIFPTEELYEKNSPLNLVESFADSSLFPALYFDIGGKDYFGFQEGTEVLRGILTKRGLPFESVFVPSAGHDIYNSRNINAIEFVLKHI